MLLLDMQEPICCYVPHKHIRVSARTNEDCSNQGSFEIHASKYIFAVPLWRVNPPQNEKFVRNTRIHLLCVFTLWFDWKQQLTRRFITLQLNHWWQMDYFDDVFYTFLDLDSVIYLAVNGTVTSLLGFIQNIINYVLETNKAFTGLEQHGWQNLHFGVE